MTTPDLSSGFRLRAMRLQTAAREAQAKLTNPAHRDTRRAPDSRRYRGSAFRADLKPMLPLNDSTVIAFLALTR